MSDYTRLNDKHSMLKYILLPLLFIIAYTDICCAIPDKPRKAIEKWISEKNYGKALETLARLPEKWQNDTEIVLLKGICYYHTDSLCSQAVGILQTAYAENQEKSLNKSILYHLAKAHTANQEYIEAIKTYNKLQQSVPANAIELLDIIEKEIDFCNKKLRTYKMTSGQTGQQTTPIPTETMGEQNQPDTTQTIREPEKNTKYTIQICSMSFPLSDTFFKGQYGIKVMRMGDLYRYVYSVYYTLAAARQDLTKVRKIYPDAFIREFDEEKLGKAIDLNMEKIK